MRTAVMNAARVAGVLIAGFALAGCGGQQPPAAPPAGTEVQVPAPVPGAEDQVSTSPAQAAPSSPGTSTAPTTTTSEEPPQSPSPDNCTAEQLALRLGSGDSGMGHSNSELRFTNRGDHACTLQGSPGVSFVAGTDGHQVGEPAERAPKSTGKLITLQPGDTASAPLSIVNPGMFDPAECKPVEVRGLRVYAPGDTASMFVDKPGSACSTPPEPQLTVNVVR